LSTKDDNPGHESHCPRCGLTLQFAARKAGPELTYDFPAWNRLCKFPVLGGPSMCLAHALEPVAATPGSNPDYLEEAVSRPLGYSSSR